MSDERFLDTNVFIYQLDRSDPGKSAIADDLIRDAVVNGKGCVSYQVVQECLNAMTRKAQVALSPADMTLYLDNVLAPLLRVGASIELYRHALAIQTRYQLSFYDSLIVAGAVDAGCTELVTEDLQNAQKIATVTINNPFA